MNLGFKLTFVIMLAVFGMVDHARAACQAYRSDPAFLADLEKDDFIARVFPSAPPQTPEQKQKLKAIARENSPGQIGELAQLEGFWRQSTGAPLPFPITMSAPFQLDIRVGSYSILDPVKVEFDADGDGKPELVQEVGQIRNSLSYTYNQEGNYEYVVTIHDRSGKIHSYKTRLRILSQAAFDGQLQTVWSEFRGALRRGETTAALDCIHTRSRNRYSEALAAIPDLAKKVDEILSAIRFVERRGGEAIYEMLRTKVRDTFSYEIRFAADFDAVWRIRSF